MYRLFIILFVVFDCLSYSYGQKQPFLSNESEKTAIYVQLHSTLYLQQVLDGLSGKELRVSKYWMPFKSAKSEELQRILRVEFESLAEARKALLYLSNLIEWVQIAELAPVNKTCYIPNDNSAVQWHLNKINAYSAWDIEKGSAAVKIAIVDEAIDIDHPDLKSKCWKNTNEIAGNGVDDDNNGYIDDYAGWQTYYTIDNPRPPFKFRSTYSHGTFCAGVAAGATNNGIGMASIGFNTTILPVACYDSLNPGKVWTGYEGVVYAADAGADVISISWGSYTYSAIAQQIIDYAATKVKAIVAAAGNDNTGALFYPAAYKNVISVTSTNKSDLKSAFSNFGSWIDLSAPGEGIFSCITGSSAKYSFLNGTSASAAMVSGLCGLMISRNPRIGAIKLLNCLKTGSDNINSINPVYSGKLGAGRINAANSLSCMNNYYADFISDFNSVCPGSTIQFTDKSVGPVTSYAWSFSGGTPTTSSSKNVTVTYANSGVFDVRLIVSNGVSFDTILSKQYIEVSKPFAKIRGTQGIASGDKVYIWVNFYGKPPYNFKLHENNKSTNYSGVISNPLVLEVTPQVETKFYISGFADSRCTGSSSDTAYISLSGGDTSSCAGDITKGKKYSKIYDAGGNETPNQIIALRDKCLLTVGITSSGLYGGDDVFLIKTDSLGKTVWSKIIGTSYNEYGIPLAIQEGLNGDLYLFGTSLRSSAYHAFILKMDSAGNYKWSKKFDNPAAHDHLRASALLSNGDILIAGTSGINNGQAAEMMRMDTNGNFKWSKSHDRSADAEHYYDIIPFKNAIYWLGSTTYGNGGYSSIITKTKMDGTDVFKKYVDYSLYDRFSSFIETADSSGFLIVASTSNLGTSTFGSVDIALLRVDTNGALVWSKIIGTSAEDLVSEISRIGSDYYITGSTKGFDGGKSKLFLIKCDGSGNIKFSKIYGETGNSYFTGNLYKSMVPDFQNNLVIIGSMTNSNTDLVMYRLNQCGDGLCKNQKVTFSESKVSPSIANASLINSGILNTSTNSMSIGTNTKHKVAEICDNKCKATADFKYVAVCETDSIILTDLSSFSNAATRRFVLWKFSDGTIIADTLGSFKYKFKKSGSYFVNQIVVGENPGFCADSIKKTIVLNNNFKGIASGSPLIICKGDSALLKAELYCGVPPYKIVWAPVNGLQNATAITTKAAPAVSQWYVFKATDAAGTIFKDSVFIAVNGSCCKYNASLAITSPQVCLGGAANLVSNSLNSSGNAKWFIVSPTGKIDSSAQTNYGSYKPTQPGFYKVLLVWKGSCKPDTAFSGITCNPRPFVYAGRDSLICSPDSVSLGDIPVERYSYKWIPAKGLSADTIANPVAWVTDSMQYIVSAKNLITGCTASDTVAVFIPDKPKLGNDTSICAGDSLYLTNPFAKATWENGQNTPKRTVKLPGNYILTLNLSGCTLADTIVLKNNALPKINLGNDTTLCQSQKIILGGAPVQNAKYKWTPGTNLSSDTVANPLANISDTAQYSVLVSDRKTGCQNRDTIRLFLPQKPVLGADTAFCKGDSVVIYNPMAGLAAWENGSKSFARTIKSPGLYRVILNAGKCALSDTIVVTEYPKPVFKITGDSAICNNKPVIVFPNIDTTGKKAFWMDNISVFKRNIAVPGKYVLTISQGKCVSANAINIVKTVTPSFDLGPDTTICLGVNYVLKVNTPYSKYSWNDGSKDSIKTVVKAGKYIVSVSNECGLLTDSVSIAYKNCICTILFPNTFTPDGNNRNDLFKAYPDCELFDYRLRIYSRWGEKLFDSRDVNTGWDGWYEGQMVPDGVYVYILDVKMYQNGVLNWENRKGTVTVLH